MRQLCSVIGHFAWQTEFSAISREWGTGRYLNWERLYSPGKGDGYMTVITEVEDEVFRTTKPLLEEWYKKGSLDTQAIPKLYDELESSIRMIYQSLLESE